MAHGMNKSLQDSQDLGGVRISQFSEVQLISLSRFDKHVRARLGGLVTAKSVKFLGKLEASLSDQETREGDHSMT
jgi:hypothetical protein